MSITIDTWRDPHETGVAITRPKQITLNEGLTVCVGCNGAGKSTLLKNIKAELKKQEIPVFLYDNLASGGNDAICSSVFNQNYSLTSALWTASEGEAISVNVGQLAPKIREFLKTGVLNTKVNRLAQIFMTEEEKDKLNAQSKQKIRCLLFDAIDSGLSVDFAIEMKNVFGFIQEEAKQLGVELYLVVVANEYEFARNENCFDVINGKYLTFDSYEDYRKFVLKSRQQKEARLAREQVAYERKQKQREARKIRYEAKAKAIKEKAKSENRDLTWAEKDQISRYELEAQQVMCED